MDRGRRVLGKGLRQLQLESLETRLALAADVFATPVHAGIADHDAVGPHHDDEATPPENGRERHEDAQGPKWSTPNLANAGGFRWQTLFGELFAEAEGAWGDNSELATSPFSLAATFALHSKPGAKHTLHLDFDGHTTNDLNWNDGVPFTSSAFDMDGNSSSFTDAELTRIQRIWQRVAEDYIPFDINVTTQDPGAAALSRTSASDTHWGQRVVIGGTSSEWYGGSFGGVAQFSFNYASDTPAFVFSKNLGSSEKYVAEAASHEAGHTLGLYHDGVGNSGYYQGHGSGATGWAPIMGNGYHRHLTQWSKGEYPNATNTWQDDLNTIVTTNGFGYRGDDHGNSANSATAVSGTVRGIIERNTDVDVFSIATSGGTLEIQVDEFEVGPNLDILAELYDSSGELITASNPADALGASLQAVLGPGTYYLHVSGTGKGDPTNGGYSDYGSLGQYSVVSTVTGDALPATLGDFVWNDLNANGVQDVGEPGVAGVSVELRNETGLVSTTTTAANGSYSFPSVAPGDYYVQFRPQPGYAFTLRDQGGDTQDSDADPATGSTGWLTLASGESNLHVDAGLTQSATLSIADATAIEGEGLVFTVVSDAEVAQGFTVDVSTTDQNATGGEDYESGPHTLNFSGIAGESQQFIVATTDDAVLESLSETFQVTLSASTPLVDDSATALGTILDNDTAALSIGDAQVTEGGTLLFTVTLDGEVDSPFDVNITYADEAASGGTAPLLTSPDYDNTPVTLAFTGSAGESKQLSVTTVDDAVLEPVSESFTVQLFATNARVEAGDTATGTILDNDAAAISISDVSVEEGGDLLFSVSVDNAVQDGFTASVNFADITATGSAAPLAEPADYVNTAVDLNFVGQAGETRHVTVPTLDDATLEAAIETLAASVTTDNTRIDTTDTGTGSIQDNEALPDIEAVTIDDDSGQRSIVRSVTVHFNQLVELEGSAFTLTGDTTGEIEPIVATHDENGKTVATLTFPDYAVEFGSLPDGNYTLDVAAAAVSTNGITMSADYSTDFFRFFGDIDSNRSIDTRDLADFLAAYQTFSSDPDFNSYFDHDGNDSLDTRDLARFLAGYGTTLPS